MKVLIVDDEVYLAQKVASRLEEFGYECDIVSSTKNIEKTYNKILLSTGLHNDDYINFIKKNKDSLILLLAPYVSDETVTAPINAGAMDYLTKPFSMDELVRKIKHYDEFKKMKKENSVLKEQNDFLFRKVQSTDVDYSFPLILSSNTTIDADKVAFDISLKEEMSLETIILGEGEVFEYNEEQYNNKILYFCGLGNLKEKDQNEFLEDMRDKKVIIFKDSPIEHDRYTTIEIEEKEQSISENNIMSINDYVKYIVLNFQDKFPDTKLSDKLGISRKSLWEKRKKLGIEKKK
jgi:DNA-binding response OmpR family regulator